MGLEPSFLFDREGSGLLGLVFEGCKSFIPPEITLYTNSSPERFFFFVLLTGVCNFFCWRKQVLFWFFRFLLVEDSRGSGNRSKATCI